MVVVGALAGLVVAASAPPVGLVAAQDAPGPSTSVAAPPVSSPASIPGAAGTAETPSGTCGGCRRSHVAGAGAGRVHGAQPPRRRVRRDAPRQGHAGRAPRHDRERDGPLPTRPGPGRRRSSKFTYNGIVDVRYGADTKDLAKGDQYLIGASVDPATGVLSSTVREAEPAFGGDDVIAAAQQDLKCPSLVDPVRTLHTDGTPVDDSLLKPLLDAKGRMLRAILLPLMIVMGVVFGLVLDALVVHRRLARGDGRSCARRPSNATSAARCGPAPTPTATSKTPTATAEVAWNPQLFGEAARIWPPHRTVEGSGQPDLAQRSRWGQRRGRRRRRGPGASRRGGSRRRGRRGGSARGRRRRSVRRAGARGRTRRRRAGGGSGRCGRPGRRPGRHWSVL